MAVKRHVRFSPLWGISLVVACGIIGGKYGKVVVDQLRLHYVDWSAHRPTATTELLKTKIPDRFVSVYPAFVRTVRNK